MVFSLDRMKIRMLASQEQVVSIQEITKTSNSGSGPDRSTVNFARRTLPIDFKIPLTANMENDLKVSTMSAKRRDKGRTFRKLACKSMASTNNQKKQGTTVQSDESAAGSSPTHQILRVRMLLPNDPILLGQENVPTYRIVQPNTDKPLKVVKNRKYGVLTQKRKTIAEKYIREILPQANEVDFGEFGCLKWCKSLLERFHSVGDLPVTIDCVKHWTNGTPWGRKICKAYEAGIKASSSALMEYDRVKSDLSLVKRKKLPEPPTQPHPAAVDGFLNDHDYCKDTWLEETLKEIFSSNFSHAAAADDLVNFLINDNSRSSSFNDMLTDASK